MALRHCTRFDELKATGRLPTPTGVALAILRLAENDRTSVAELSRVLASDPAVSGRVLKLANSAQCGASRPASSISEASVRLGFRTVRNIALGFEVISRHGRGACKQFDYPGFWSQSLATALAAQAAALQLRYPAPGEAFTCGLLCRIGALTLASIYPEEYGQILTQCQGEPVARLLDREQQRFATDQSELTVALLRDWGLPAECLEGVRNCNDPYYDHLTEGAAVTLARLLHLASHLASICVAGQRPEALFPELIRRGQLLGLVPDELLPLGDRVVAEWRDWGKVLEVKTQEVPAFADLAERYQRLDAEAGEASGLTVLVVDANAARREINALLLADAGHVVLSARDGEEAVRLVLEAQPDLVLADEELPDSDALTLSRTLRQSKLGRQVYLVLLTAKNDENRAVAAFDAGVDDYLVKPVSPRLLLARVRAAGRFVQVQREVDRDREEMLRFAGELAVANRTLQRAALTDPLTGLHNRRYAMERLAQEWNNATRHGRSLACLIVDIDHFKRINDTHGHDVGDLMLREIAELLANTVRQSDVVCRIGGEEFLVLCPGADQQAAQHCAARLCARVQDQLIHAGEYALPITLSIGVAAREGSVRTVQELLKRADQAVYAAKASGRNRIHPPLRAHADLAARNGSPQLDCVCR